MSLPETCPFCGAGVAIANDGKARRSERWVEFGCGTNVHWVADARRFQSSECEVRERLRLAARVAEVERELEQAKADRARAAMDARNPLMAQLAELEARCKRLEEAARAVYLDSIASDHPWTELETRNMHALRDVLEAKP